MIKSNIEVRQKRGVIIFFDYIAYCWTIATLIPDRGYFFWVV